MTDTTDVRKRLADLVSEPMTTTEALAVLRGEDLAAHRERAGLRDKIDLEARQYVNVPPGEWPPLTFNWDLSEAGQRYALDGVGEGEFCDRYSDGLELGWVYLPDFTSRLCRYNRRDVSELWTVGDGSKVARLTAYIAGGLPVTPPLIGVYIVSAELVIQGGNHRYAVAQAAGVQSLPIWFEPKDRGAIETIIQIFSERTGPSNSRQMR